MEFESNYKSNHEMQKRMLRYFSYFYWNDDLPVFQVVVLLKEPENIKKVSTGINHELSQDTKINYRYKVVKLYEIDKYDLLEEHDLGLFPLRIFMKHEGETEFSSLYLWMYEMSTNLSTIEQFRRKNENYK